MAAIDKARTLMDERLVTGEAVVDARQVMTPGSMTSFAFSGSLPVMGGLGALAFQSLGGRASPDPEHLDPGRQVPLHDVDLGVIAFTDRRLLVLPPNPDRIDQRIEMPLQGLAVAYNDHGRLYVAVRDLLVVAADDRWFLAELSTGYGRAKKVEAFTTGLAASIAAYG